MASARRMSLRSRTITVSAGDERPFEEQGNPKKPRLDEPTIGAAVVALPALSPHTPAREKEVPPPPRSSEMSAAEESSDDEEAEAKPAYRGRRMGARGRGRGKGRGRGRARVLSTPGKRELVLDEDSDDDVVMLDRAPVVERTAGQAMERRMDKGKSIVLVEDDKVEAGPSDSGVGEASSSLDGLISEPVPESEVGSIEERARGLRVDDESREVPDVDDDGSVLPAVHGGSEQAGPSQRVENRVEVARARNLSIARRRASHFAHFQDPAAEPAARGDWPGPFAVARRLVEERELAASQRAAAAGQTAANAGPPQQGLVSWLPSRGADFVGGKKKVVKTLQDMTIENLCVYIDHVELLGVLPDECIRKICARLCELRKMNARVLRLLLDGAPADLIIPDCSGCAEEDFAEAMAEVSTERLQAMELGMCGRVFVQRLVDSMADKHSFAYLRKLSLRGAYRLMDDDLIKILQLAGNLTSLELQECNYLTERSVGQVASLFGSQLKSLSLENCRQLNGMNMLASLVKMPGLQMINLSGVANVADGMIQELVSAVGKNLEELYLAECSHLTDVAMVSITTFCPRLRVLNLDMVSLLTDASLEVLVKNGIRLQRLSIKRCKFSDEALAAFFATLDGCLRHLSLNAVRQAADKTLLALAQHPRSSLETLDVSWCRQVTDQGLGLLADSCPNLSELRMFGCTQVTDVFKHGHSNSYIRLIGDTA